MFILIDTSGSMSGAIEKINMAMSGDIKTKLLEIADDKNLKILMHVLRFDEGQPRYVVGTENGGVELTDGFIWTNLPADGNRTYTGEAIEQVYKDMKVEFIGLKALNPIVILITDGYANGQILVKDAAQKLKTKFMKKDKSGDLVVGQIEKLIRVGIGVKTPNGDYQRNELEDFATIGTLNEVENQPFVFEVEKLDNLGDIFTNIVVASLYASSLASQEDDPAVTPKMVTTDPDEEII
jgi:uncharacterized protein YegL